MIDLLRVSHLAQKLFCYCVYFLLEITKFDFGLNINQAIEVTTLKVEIFISKILFADYLVLFDFINEKLHIFDILLIDLAAQKCTHSVNARAALFKRIILAASLLLKLLHYFNIGI